VTNKRTRNLNGINSKLLEFKNILAKLEMQPDIICLQETFLKENKSFIIPAYNIERRDRQDRNRGGVATLIKQHMAYTVSEPMADAEEITIAINLNGQNINISNIYNPPGKKLDELTYTAIASRPNIIITGDLNSYSPLFGGNATSSNGKLLEQLIDNNNLSVLNDGSGTHLKQNGELSAIDVSLASPNIAIKSSWTVFNDSIGSDHYPVIIIYNETQKIPEISRRN